ncbi:microtubule binding protein YTM1-like protein [Leptotrombidium deliense]|uniref:Ribosome biogenesis protein WDR12 homolog n=1 Tax=Leptotrombidium deliense TaxID=299467 RepID=A0A443SV39_9ACAR|nr:microtubule binding protein YTM1-like protein [Leptotrombidium deliense]
MSSFQVKFVTKDEKCAIPAIPYAVNVATGGKELNALLNAVLEENNEEWEQREFDFLICDKLLRTSLEEHLKELTESSGKSFTGEQELIVEYVEKHSTPEAFNSLLNDDWVSCVHTNDTHIINGCYDGVINIWDISGQHLTKIPAHAAPVKDIRFVDGSKLKDVGLSFSNNELLFVSASHDENCIFWKFNCETNEVDYLSVFKGHERSVDCVDVYNDVFATGSFDNMIKIWSLIQKSEDSDEKINVKKKQKLGESSKVESKTRTPLLTIGGHSEAVTDLVWLNDFNSSGAVDLATCSMDNTIRLWDIELAEEKSNLKGSKAFLSIDYSRVNHCLITGSCDRHIRLWDPRSEEGTLVKAAFTNHTGWVSSVCWSTTNEHLFISGSYDNCVKLWDRRSQVAPLFDLTGHNDKVLAVDWSNPKFVISGASDNYMKIYQNKDHA